MPLSDELLNEYELLVRESGVMPASIALKLLAEVRELRKQHELADEHAMLAESDVTALRAQLIDAKAKHENALQISNYYRAQRERSDGKRLR